MMMIKNKVSTFTQNDEIKFVENMVFGELENDNTRSNTAAFAVLCLFM